MGMKLLPKSEIAANKAAAKKSEIDEGQRLAKRIDAMRETLLNEEKSLEQFRSRTVALIHSEIEKENRILSDLRTEIRDLTVKRQELMVPLDSEWARVNEELEEISHQFQEIDKAWKSIKDSDLEVKEKLREASATVKRAETTEAKAKEMLKNASELELKARNTSRQAVRKLASAEVLSEKVVSELMERDKNLASRERDYTIREAQLLERESDIERDWKLLEDRKATFERHIKRLKQ